MDFSKLVKDLQVPPMRPMNEFVVDKEWAMPNLNPKEFDALQKQVISNLIRFQINYAVVLAGFLVAVGFFHPVAIIFGLIVLAGLLVGFVYAMQQQNNMLAILKDRPILILVLLLIAAYMIIRLFSCVMPFVMGIALPLALSVVHATVRKPLVEKQGADQADKSSTSSTPMDLLVKMLSAQIIEQQPQQPKSSNKRK